MTPNNIIPGAPILLLGEAPGEMEEALGKPFVGPSGRYLRRLLQEAEIDVASCSTANVFTSRPKDGKLENFAGPGKGTLYKGNLLGAFATGVYFDPGYSLPALEFLEADIIRARPNIIIALGNTALWALTGKTGIGRARGSITASTVLVPGTKVLPTYHPAAVMRSSEDHAVVVADLIKAKLESTFREIRRMRRVIWIAEHVEDIDLFFRAYPIQKELTVDVETFRKQITVVGFAVSKTHALVIPIYNKYHKTNPHVWTFEQERVVWRKIKKIMEGPSEKVLQNGVYDIQYFLTHGIVPVNFKWDTMLMHHALYSQLPKGLEFLGATYTNEIAWKSMRPRATEEKKNA